MGSARRIRLALCYLTVAIGLGCATQRGALRSGRDTISNGPVGTSGKPTTNAQPSLITNFLVETQYRPRIEPSPAYYHPRLEMPTFINGKPVWPPKLKYGCPLLEIYLTNQADERLEFVRLFLNGNEVRELPSNDLYWWQFYPCPTLPPRSTILLQLSMVNQPNSNQAIEVETRSGQRLRVRVPAFTSPRSQIIAITFKPDFSTMYIAYRTSSSGRRPPAAIQINGRHMTKESRILESAVGSRPGLIAVDPKGTVHFGDPVHVRLELTDGTVASSMVRACSGLWLDAAGIGEHDEKWRKRLALDQRLLNRWTATDAACDDAKARFKFGQTAPALIGERVKAYETDASKLFHIFLCVSATPDGTFPIYGQCADGLVVSPYRLQYASIEDAGRFVEADENYFRWGWHAARPRPWYWMAEAFAKISTNRMLEPEELRLLVYSAVGHGAKGIQYFACDTAGGVMYDSMFGFLNSVKLSKAIAEINRELRSLEPILSTAFPVSIETFGSKNSGLRAYTLWCGEQGMLVIVRNLDYYTDRKPNDFAEKPRFRAKPKTLARVRVSLPTWLNLGRVVDPLHANRAQLPSRMIHHNRLELDFRDLELVKLAWIENESAERRGIP